MPSRLLLSEGSELSLAGACDLDSEGARAQGERYRHLTRHVVSTTRTLRHLSVEFSTELDQSLLEEALVVERGCCSFLGIDYEPTARRLTLSVDRHADSRTLDAIESVLA